MDENEQMGNVRETLTKVGLSDLLKGTTMAEAGGNSLNVHQYLRFGGPNGISTNPLTGSVIFGENEYDQTGNFLFYDDGDGVFEYELGFEEGFESAVDANGNLTDLVGKTLPILGKDYRVVKAQRTGNLLDLEMMAGQFKTQQAAVGQQTYVIDDTEYAVSMLSVDANGNAQYQINGEVTPVLQPGSVYKLANGLMFGHVNGKDDPDPWLKVTNFALKANKLSWSDSNASDNQYDDYANLLPPVHDNEMIEDARTRIQGQSLPNGNFELSSIRYKLLGDFKVGDGYVGAGQTLGQMLDEPAGIPGQGFDIKYEGFVNGKHLVRVCDKAGN
jgi:hypothetical protein